MRLTPDEAILFGIFTGIILIGASVFSDDLIFKNKKGSIGEWALKTFGEKKLRIFYTILGFALILLGIWMFNSK